MDERLTERGDVLTLPYTNYRGEFATRRVIPYRIWHGATEWHPEQQWFLRAFDLEKKAVRDFAFEGIGRAALAPEGEKP